MKVKFHNRFHRDCEWIGIEKVFDCFVVCSHADVFVFVADTGWDIVHIPGTTDGKTREHNHGQQGAIRTGTYILSYKCVV